MRRWFLNLNVYFVEEITILHLYCKFTTFINGKTTLFIFYKNDSYDRHSLRFRSRHRLSLRFSFRRRLRIRLMIRRRLRLRFLSLGSLERRLLLSVDGAYVPTNRCYGNASTRKRLNAEMPQKQVLRNFRFFWEIPQNWKMLRDFRKFLRRFLIFKVEVFPLFFWGVSVFFFWGVSVFWKKF